MILLAITLGSRNRLISISPYRLDATLEPMTRLSLPPSPSMMFAAAQAAQVNHDGKYQN